MNHPTDSQLNEYLDRAMDESARRALDLHIAECEACRARLEELQFLFSELENLPESDLARDLAPSILPQLPVRRSNRWNPSIAAQLGAALGAFFWLAVQFADSIPSMLGKAAELKFPFLSIQAFHFIWPSLPPTDLQSWFSFRPPIFIFSPLRFPEFQISEFNLLLIGAGISILWLIGNLSLLRGRPGVQK